MKTDIYIQVPLSELDEQVEWLEVIHDREDDTPVLIGFHSISYRIKRALNYFTIHDREDGEDKRRLIENTINKILKNRELNLFVK